MNSSTTAISTPDFTYYSTEGSIIGLAPLMTMAYKGVDLATLGQNLLEEARVNSAAGPSALLDVSIIMQLKGDPDGAMNLQQQALSQRQLYRIPATRQPSIRLLVIKAPGLLAANTPLEFLVEDSNIELTMLYVAPNLLLPEMLPDHDVMFVAIGHSEQNIPILKLTEEYISYWPRPVLNLPNRITPLTRDITADLLQSVPRAVMPATSRVERLILERVARGELNTSPVCIDIDFPIIIRPARSNDAGIPATKLDQATGLSEFLAKTSATDFFVTPFVDYRGKDGQFRKYRIVLIDGRAFPCQMAISNSWMPNFNGGADANGQKRFEEERFMANFDEDFGPRHSDAFRCIARRFGLDYLVVDCAETRDGKLLILEADSSAVVHALDPMETSPYKKAQLNKIAGAFSEILVRKARSRVG